MSTPNSKYPNHKYIELYRYDCVTMQADLGPVYMRLGQIQTGMKMEIVNMFT
jgi:hypothetical protein